VDDVFLGLEVVVKRGLGDAKPLGDLAQRGLLVALLGEQFERDLLRPGPGIGAWRAGVTGLVRGRTSRAGGALAAAVVHRERGPLVIHVPCCTLRECGQIYLTAG